MKDRHVRRYGARRVHDNGFPTRVYRPGMSLAEIRDIVRGRRRRSADDVDLDDDDRDLEGAR